MGFQSTTQVIGSTDQQIIQLLSLCRRESKEYISNSGQWSGMPEIRREYTFNLVPVGPYTGTLTPGSASITNMSSIVGITAPSSTSVMGIAGNGIYPSSTVVSASGTTVVMSAPPSMTSVMTGVSLNFGQIAYPLPSDIQFFISATQWDRNFRWQMLGPLSAQEWQTIVSGISPVGPRLRFRVMDSLFYIQPVPGASQTDQIAYEYISNVFCKSSGGTLQSEWMVDTDTYLFPEDICTLGIKWRFLRAKGLDYSEEYNSWVNARDRQFARSGGNRSLPLNAVSTGLRLLNQNNIPDSGYGT